MCTTGNRTGAEPSERNASTMGGASSAVRVITKRFPYRTDGARSASGTVHLLQDRAGTRVDQLLRELLSEFAWLVCRPRCTLTHVLGSVRRAYNCVHNQLTTLEPRPCTERNLAATLQRAE